MKILSITLIVGLLATLLLGACFFYDIHHEVDRTPIVEIPFDPSKKDVIKLENFKMPRSGYFHLAFFVGRKDKKTINSNDMDYLRDNGLYINFKATKNRKEFKTGKETWNGNIKPLFYQVRDNKDKAILRIKNQQKFRKNDVLDIVIENKYPNDKFRDFDIVFGINEVKPAK